MLTAQNKRKHPNKKHLCLPSCQGLCTLCGWAISLPALGVFKSCHAGKHWSSLAMFTVNLYGICSCNIHNSPTAAAFGFNCHFSQCCLIWELTSAFTFGQLVWLLLIRSVHQSSPWLTLSDPYVRASLAVKNLSYCKIFLL